MSSSTVQQTSTKFVSLPRVNLLPPEIEEQRRFRKVQTGLGLAALASVGVVGALLLLANGQVNDAQKDLDAENSRTTVLQTQTAKYAEVPLVYDQVEAAEAQLGEAMSKEVRWSYFLNDLSLATPRKVWLTSMTVTQDMGVAADAAAVSGDVNYLQAGVGNIVFEGKGYGHNDVAAWLDALAKQKGLTQPYFTVSDVEKIGDEDVVKFSSQATITEDAFSGRFTGKAGS
jgi:Tfp pilus assembly protein PilN